MQFLGGGAKYTASPDLLLQRRALLAVLQILTHTVLHIKCGEEAVSTVLWEAAQRD